MTNVKQMLSAIATNQVYSLSSVDPRVELEPAISIVTTEAEADLSPTHIRKTTRLTALLVADFRVEAAEFVSSAFVELYMSLDGERFGPGFPVSIAPRASFSFLAFTDEVQPGKHVVQANMSVARPAFIAATRTLTLWETVVVAEPPGGSVIG